MKLYRAKEILSSEHKISVELNGQSVWIDSVDSDKETVKVHVEDNPADTRIVSAEQLQEV